MSFRSAAEACHQEMEFLALNGDMTAQHLGGALCLSGAQGGDDRLVFGHGLCHAPAQAQLHPTKRFQAAVQAQRLLFEKAVARVTIDHVVKPLILAVVSVGIVCRDGLRAAGVGGVEIGESLFRDAVRGEAAANSLDFGHGLEHFHQFDRAGLTYKGPATWDLHGQT